MRFGLLGALTLGGEGAGETFVTSPRQRVLLAALLLHANTPVSVDTLAELVWDGRPPPGAPATLRSHVRHLRATLGVRAEGLVARDPGYMIRVAEPALDTTNFEALCRQAGVALRSARWSDVCTAAEAAVRLWRGTPLLDVPSQQLRDQFQPHFERLRLQVLEDRIDAELHLGRYDEVVARLRPLIVQYPVRERLHARLMVALASSGRQAEALDVYRDARGVLVDELGVEPGVELREVHERILGGGAGLTALSAITSAGRSSRNGAAPPNADGVPHQLPATVRYFTGRAEELRVLSDLLARTGRTEDALPIALVCGYGGIGKTALAVAFAHRCADSFPGGQVYLNLRGFDPGGAPLGVATAVRRILDAFAIPAARIPVDLDGQIDLYRSHIAGRRVLLLLDNARDADQVRPLLPGSGDTLVVVTSRDRLAGLVAIEGAVPLILDVLSNDEAGELLTRRLGAARTSTETRAVTDLVLACGGLPLALNIAAARVALNPTASVAGLVEEVRDRSTAAAQVRLDQLSTGDSIGDVRTVFSWSYQLLDPAAAGMFRLLGLHPGPDIDVEAAARLAGVGLGQAAALLDLLTQAHLVSEQPPGRFVLHDLLRAYAAELTSIHDSESVRRAAVGRALDHYRAAAHAAAMVLNPGWIPLDLPAPEVAPVPPADPAQAVAWFAAHYGVLTAAITWAAGSGFGSHAWQICWSLANHLESRGLRDELRAAVRIALPAAVRAGDLEGQAFARRRLADLLVNDGAYAEAETELAQVLSLYSELGDRLRTGNTYITMARNLERQNRIPEALAQTRRALELFRDSEYRGGLSQALNCAGWYQAELGLHDQALASCTEALELIRAIGQRPGEAHTLDSLANIYVKVGDYAAAISHYDQALTIHRELGNRPFCATVLASLGDVHHAAGDSERARASWAEALAIFDDLGHPRAGELRARIRDLAATPAPAR
jgi:DNA-binding SARP family transcriptional activator